MNKETQEVIIPSAHQIAETVTVDFIIGGKLKDCQIAGIQFTDYGKVLYDIHVPVGHDGEEEMFATIHAVDSAFVEKQ